MPSVKFTWTPSAKSQFEELRKRASDAGKHQQFVRVHNEIVTALRDLKMALEKGELLFATRKAGGEVRHWVHQFISVCYAVFRDEPAGWILKYRSVPDSWPD